MRVGIDVIGGANYPRRIINHFPERMAIGILDVASGWPRGILTLDDVLGMRSDITKARLSGIWHDDHTFGKRDIRPAVRIGVRLAKMADRYPDVQFWYQPWLEPRAKQEHRNILVERLKKKLPKEIKIVMPGYCTNRVIDEAHHNFHGKYGAIFSYDGDHTRNVQEYKDHYKSIGCPLFFGWEPECNGLTSLTDTTPRDQRTNYPKRDFFREMERKLRR